MARRRTLLAVAVAVVLASSGLTACDPPPPRLALAVTSTAGGVDDAPGDGACTSAAAGGLCTLRAAIDEGNTAPAGADVTLPPGVYPAATATVVGDVRLNPAATASVAIRTSTLTVADGGHLELSGINTSQTQGDLGSLRLVVQTGGGAAVVRTLLATVSVQAGGTVALTGSLVFDINGTAVSDGGTLVAVSSSILTNVLGGVPAPALATGPGGRSYLAASVVATPVVRFGGGTVLGPGGGGTCAGTAPTSVGYAFVEVGCGTAPQPGDGSGPALTAADATIGPTGTIVGMRHSLDPGSPLIDAIPIGDPRCDTAAVDLYGTPRGIDGDGDGLGGCDVGAVERHL